MNDTEIVNAKITHTELGYNDIGIFTCYLTLDYGDSGQGFGGYCLYSEKSKGKPAVNFGMEYLDNILAVVGVSTWEEIPGKHIRVEKQNMLGPIKRIGHLLEDIWFDPEALAKQYQIL